MLAGRFRLPRFFLPRAPPGKVFSSAPLFKGWAGGDYGPGQELEALLKNTTGTDFRLYRQLTCRAGGQAVLRVLGIDPGLAITGFGVVEERDGECCRVASGSIQTSREEHACRRLERIFTGVLELKERYAPAAVAVEKLFFAKNSRTALQVGEARGVVLLAIVRGGLELFEYTPLQVKQAVAGYGLADKGQICRMVGRLLGLAETPALDDEADALAVALCHLHHRRWQEAVTRGGGGGR